MEVSGRWQISYNKELEQARNRPSAVALKVTKPAAATAGEASAKQ